MQPKRNVPKPQHSFRFDELGVLVTVAEAGSLSGRRAVHYRASARGRELPDRESRGGFVRHGRGSDAATALTLATTTLRLVQRGKIFGLRMFARRT